MKIEDMIWIEDIVKNTLAPTFFTNSRIDMVCFVDPYNLAAKRSRLLTFPSAQNGVQ
jgi:hypothetical protein